MVRTTNILSRGPWPQEQILGGYVGYILHLDRTLEHAKDAFSRSNNPKRLKDQVADEWLRICTILRKHQLEA
jgi:hypothetical protein